VGKRDFALIANGGAVSPRLTSRTSPESDHHSLPSESVLSDDFRIDGCWSILGSKGQVGVRLAETIRPSHITIDHVPALRSEDLSAAPRHIILWGVVDGPENRDMYPRLLARVSDITPQNRSAPPISLDYAFVPLASFEYNILANVHVQTFPVHPSIVESHFDVGVVVLEVAGNWGGNTTCLYRLRVHGE
ncbi:hypothetical protein K466DRAFT_443144, partial [Polyporus arcularius HHB13444]